MSFSKGDLFHIEMRSGIYQVLDLYGSDDKGSIYYFRKVFDEKLNLKISKAEFVHESWMHTVSAKKCEKLSEIINLPETKMILSDLAIDRMMRFGTSEKVDIMWCTIDPKAKNKLEKQLNSEINGWVDPLLLRNALTSLHNQGELHIETGLVCPSNGKRLYRVELGRYCDDFDEYGNECFREIRFFEIKMYRRADLI